MAKVYNLYDHNVEPIGTATFNKAKNGYMVAYTDYVHYVDTFVPLEEFEAYKANLKLNSMSGKQVTLEDFI